MSARSRLQAVSVVALSWGVLWAIVGAVLGLFVMARDSEAVGVVALLAGVLGFCGTLCGAGFAALLSSRRVSLGGFPSVRRSAGLGAIAAAAVILVVMATAGFGMFPYYPEPWPAMRLVGIAAGLGSVSAAALVSLAGRAPIPAAHSGPQAT